jgi:hypothetical protein
MTLRSDREDTREQQERLAKAKADLVQAFEDLATEAKYQARAARSKWGTGDPVAVYAATEVVRRAEQAVDIATSDLATARGEDA